MLQRELPPTQAGDPDRLAPLIAEALRGGGGSVLVFCASRRQCQVRIYSCGHLTEHTVAEGFPDGAGR